VEVFNAEVETGVFSRVQTRGGRPAGKQWPTIDAGGDRGGHFAIDVAELASSGSWGDGAIEGGNSEHFADAVASGPGVGDHAVETGARSYAHGARRAKKSDRHLRGGAEMSFRFIRDHAGRWPIRLMCRVLEVSASGYYAWRNRPDSARVVANRALLADVRRLHGEHHGRYGSPRMHAALRAEGRTASRGRVARLMRRHGIRALAGRRFRPCTTDSRHDLPIAPNLLKQAFVASAPNRIWLADITYIATGEGWLYLAAVLDLATRKIVGWSMRDHMRTELPLSALMMAAQRQRPAEGLICHSDRGSQYASEAYGKQLAAMKAKPSMSRTACCYDNAPMESFFHTLKVELAHQRQWTTREDARRDLFAYIEGYYNRRRIHSAIGYRTPEQAERQMA
jgi:putative transposase